MSITAEYEKTWARNRSCRRWKQNASLELGVSRGFFVTEEVLELAKANPEDWNKLCQDVDGR